MRAWQMILPACAHTVSRRQRNGLPVILTPITKAQRDLRGCSNETRPAGVPADRVAVQWG
jgi:hypothetical protein